MPNNIKITQPMLNKPRGKPRTEFMADLGTICNLITS